jgi:hypothetical protein
MKRFRPITDFDLVPGGGRYYSAGVVNILFGALVLIPMWLVYIAVDRLLPGSGISDSVSTFAWRLFDFKIWLMQRIYLGCEPQLWAALNRV